MSWIEFKFYKKLSKISIHLQCRFEKYLKEKKGNNRIFYILVDIFFKITENKTVDMT